MSDSLRSDEMTKRYQEFRASGAMVNCCKLCDKDSIKEFEYWKIGHNDFPYDKVADTHHMIMPLRHVIEDEITDDEWCEFKEIKKELLRDYEYILEAGSWAKSIPDHFHLHLIIGKNE